jgi:hypothetical protein
MADPSSFPPPWVVSRKTIALVPWEPVVAPKVVLPVVVRVTEITTVNNL